MKPIMWMNLSDKLDSFFASCCRFENLEDSKKDEILLESDVTEDVLTLSLRTSKHKFEQCLEVRDSLHSLEFVVENK